ncbi:MAG: hypothetical protein RRB13_04530 [bacterium]|nr:hypothetical protein [bacterium]
MKGLTICAALLALFWTGAAPAQVITPSLDPSVASMGPAATGWKTEDVVALAYTDRTGKREQSGVQQYEFTGSQSDVMLALTMEGAAFELASSNQSTGTKPEGVYDQPVPISNKTAQANLAIQGNDFFSMGLGYRTEEKERWLSQSYPHDRTKLTYAGGALSVRLGESFYVGGGASRVREASDLYVDNNWVESQIGLAMLFGQPGDTRFRFEASLTQTPKALQNAAADRAPAAHPGSDLQRGALELEFSGLLFSFQGDQLIERVVTVDAATGQTSSQTESVSSRAGVLWVPEMGMSLGFYFGNQQVKQLYTDSFSDFQVKLGYLF